MIVVGIFKVLQGLSTVFLIPNLNRIVCHVQEGTLDFLSLGITRYDFLVVLLLLMQEEKLV
ncbi:hypothetical protein RINTHM_980 [Richelia intracellularis HM01]|uniref:ABC-2 family transporter protein n=1 Tax=Richelia intracellularis TaxID=1164990 RepID=UPI0002B5A1F0|nr:ABC-2 family transporter protein [Richelia intracellularis]CCH64581.1 hypothetical protein RINTHM_980 [Richelia intracellularis HM01]